MKEGWTYKTLGELCNVINGLWTGKKEPFINVAVIRNTNFSKDCRLKLDDVAYIDVEAKQFATRKLEYGDIIIEKSGGSDKQPVGRAVLFDIIDGDYSFSNFTATLRIKDKAITHPKFLYQNLLWHYQMGMTEKMQSKTTGLHNLDMKAYLRISIPVPPLAEQERIVAELDLLTEIIDKQKAQIKELDTLAQSIFYDMFGDPVENEKGWEIQRLGDICNFSQGLQVDVEKQSTVPQEGWYRFLRIVDYTSDNQDVRYIHDNNPKYWISKDDIAMVRYGSVGVVGSDKEGILANNLFRINYPRNCLNKYFLVQLFRTDYFTSFIKKTAFGATMPALSFKTISSFLIYLPPLSLQQSFADKINTIEQQKAAITQSIAETQKLFDYTMDKYFG